MSKFENGYTYEDGVKAGNRLLDLICEINPAMTPACGQFTPEEKLNEIYAEIWNLSESKHPLPCIAGFLSWVLKPSRFDSELIAFWGANELRANQRAYSPVCELPGDCGIVQLGYWTGEAEGDAWCLDLNGECIRCISVDSAPTTLAEARLNSYGVFYSLYQWVAYLRCSAWERGWIQAP